MTISLGLPLDVLTNLEIRYPFEVLLASPYPCSLIVSRLAPFGFDGTSMTMSRHGSSSHRHPLVRTTKQQGRHFHQRERH